MNNAQTLKKGKSSSNNTDRFDDLLRNLSLANPTKLTLKDCSPADRSNLIHTLISQYEVNKSDKLFSMEIFWREIHRILENGDKGTFRS